MALIDINEQEGQALINIIDVAVRNSGLASAETGIHLARKIQQAFAVASTSGAVGSEPEEVKEGDGN